MHEEHGKMYFNESGRETPYYRALKEQGSRLAGYGDGKVVPVMTRLTFERIHSDAVLPKYAKDGDSGMDVYAVEDVMLAPGETALIPLGLLAAIPRHPFHELGYRWEMQARPRSGVSAKSALRVSNAPGTIDNTFRGELKIIIDNNAWAEFEVEHERDDDTNAVTRVELNKMTSSYVRGIDGGHIFTGNFTANAHGTYLIRKGDRIAQLVLVEVIRPQEIVEGKVSTDTDRGADGFGSTGVQG